MKYRCPMCERIYDELTHDGFCTRPECWGEQLVGYFGKEEEPHGVIEGLCVLVCDASFSMDEKAFPNDDKSKLMIVTTAVQGAISDLFRINRAERAFIGIIAYGATAALILDMHGNPFILSLSEIKSQFGNGLGQHLYSCFQSDVTGVDRRYSDFMVALHLAREMYDAALSGDLSSYGVGQRALVGKRRGVVSSSGQIMSVPNVRVMLYSDGELKPERTGDLSNPFASLEPSPLMTVFIGDESISEGARRRADDLKELANICPIHGMKGYFVINTRERHVALRGLFRMGGGASGFCPECTKAHMK